MHDFIDGIRPLDDVLYDIQEYCEKGTSLKKNQGHDYRFTGRNSRNLIKKHRPSEKTVQNLFAQQHQRNHLVEL